MAKGIKKGGTPLRTERSMLRNKQAREEAKAKGATQHDAHFMCPKGHESKRYVSDHSCVACRRERRSAYDKDWNHFRQTGKHAMDMLYEQLSGISAKGRVDARAALENMRDNHHYSRVRNYAKELLDRFDEQHTVPESDS